MRNYLTKLKENIIISCPHNAVYVDWKNLGDINKPMVKCADCLCRIPDHEPIAQVKISEVLIG